MTLSKRQTNWIDELKGLRASPIMYWRDVQASVRREAEGVLTKVEAEGRDLSPGEQRWIEGSHADLTFIDTKIQEQEVILEKERQEAASHFTGPLSMYPPDQTLIHGGTPADLGGEAAALQRRRLQQKPGMEGRRYADLFGPVPQGASGFSSMEEYFQIVHSGLHHPQLIQAATHVEGTPSAGGFLVPVEYAAQMLDSAIEESLILQRVIIEPMASETKLIAGLDIGDHSSGALFGGLTPEWAGENDTATTQAAKWRQIRLTAHKLRIYSEASSELISDGTSFEQQLGEAMTKGLGWGLEYAVLRGTGAGSPLGCLSDPSLITVSAEVGQLQADGVLYINCVNMMARLHPASFSRAVFAASSTLMPSLLSLSVGVGTAGVWLPAVREDGGRFTLLGFPLIFTEKLPALTDALAGSLLLADFSQYTVGMRKEVTVEKSNAPGWARDVQSYRSILRADGLGRWNKSQVPRHGDSRSWVVALPALT